jgi:hypothetical protein
VVSTCIENTWLRLGIFLSFEWGIVQFGSVEFSFVGGVNDSEIHQKLSGVAVANPTY